MMPKFQWLNIIKEFLVLITDQPKWVERRESFIPRRQWSPRLFSSWGIAIPRISKSFTSSAQAGKSQVWKILQVSMAKACKEKGEEGISFTYIHRPELSHAAHLIPREAGCSGGKKTGFGEKHCTFCATKPQDKYLFLRAGN